MPLISTTQAQASLKKIYGDSDSMSPSALIHLFEIEILPIANDLDYVLTEGEGIFRFHNNIKLLSKSIWFQGKEYVAAPIIMEDLEVASRGTLPTPKLSLTVDDTGIEVMALFKSTLANLGDLVGAKVTRKATFLKYIDERNFYGQTAPDGFSPDPNAEFPPQIFYIDRKSKENKYTLEYTLASVLDVENIKLPARLVLAKRCVWQYRGEGCAYEYSVLRNPDVHGDTVLPAYAPPVATANDELIQTILGSGVVISEPEKYDPFKLTSYKIGNSVYIQKNGLNYYFVASVNQPSAGPPNTNYWIADQCSRLCGGCRLRWGTDGSVSVGLSGLVKGQLPFGGYPAADKVY